MNKKLLTPLHFNFLCQRAYQEGTHITSDTHESAGDAHPLATNAQSIPALLQTKSLFFPSEQEATQSLQTITPYFPTEQKAANPLKLSVATTNSCKKTLADLGYQNTSWSSQLFCQNPAQYNTCNLTLSTGWNTGFLQEMLFLPT